MITKVNDYQTVKFPSLLSSATQAAIINPNEIRAAKTMFYVVGSFFVCWAPLAFLVVLKWIIGNDALKNKPLIAVIENFCYCAIHYNTAINPTIYALRIADVRNAIKRTFGCEVAEANVKSDSTPNSRNISVVIKRPIIVSSLQN